MTFKPAYNYHKHFIVRLVDEGCEELKALRVSDAFLNTHSIYLKDKRAVRDLVAQLMVHIEDLDESKD
ncbi:MAG: hypothetical protein JWL77_6789 [Chthonomonadaceae bacterium]|nr:hypothetical protein [Chthonomonadaceae bacterium]